MNASELKTELDKIFTTIVGVPRAFMEIPQRPRRDANDEAPVTRIIYSSISVSMRGQADLIEPVLCGWVFGRLRALMSEEQAQDRSELLIWRTAPIISEFTDNTGHWCTNLRLRLAIPGSDISDLESKEGEPRWL